MKDLARGYSASRFFSIIACFSNPIMTITYAYRTEVK